MSSLVSFAGEGLESLKGLELQMPCLVSRKCEVSEEALKDAEKVTDKVSLLKGAVNQYIVM